MRVAILGDIHGNVQYLDWALEHAVNAGAGMMIQVGDFGFNYNDTFLHYIVNVTKKHQIPLYAIRGNHDDFSFFTKRTQLGRYITLIPDGMIMTIGKKRVAFLGGAVSIDRDLREENVSWWKEERVSPHIVNAWMYDDVKADVLISHDSPVLPDNLLRLVLPPDILRDCEEDRHLVRMAAEILEPDVIYHGHHHMRHTKDLYLDTKKTLIEGLNCNWVDLDQSMIIQDW